MKEKNEIFKIWVYPYCCGSISSSFYLQPFLFTFSRDWPWILIIIGLLNLISFEKKKSVVNINISSGKRRKILEDLKEGKISVEEAMEEFEEE